MKKELVTEDGITYKKHSMSKKDKKNSVLYMLASILGVMVFFILPFFVVIYYALVDNPINHQFVGLDNFIRILQNSSFLQAAKNTATFSLVAVPLAVILSLVMAMILEENIPMKSQFRTFFLKNLGGAPIDWFKSSYSQIVIVVLFLWKNLGYNMILFMSALNAIPKDVLEVAKLESASDFQIFRYIKLRYLSSTILFVAILSLINSFKVFREVYLLTGDYPYDSLYMLQHFMNNTFKSLDYQKLSAAAIIMGIVMCIVIGFLFFVEDRYGKDVEG